MTLFLSRTVASVMAIVLLMVMTVGMTTPPGCDAESARTDLTSSLKEAIANALAEGESDSVEESSEEGVQGSCMDGPLPIGAPCWPGDAPEGQCPCADGLLCDDVNATCIFDSTFPITSIQEGGEIYGRKCLSNPAICGDDGSPYSCEKLTNKKAICLHNPRWPGEHCGKKGYCSFPYVCKKGRCVHFT